MDINSHIKDRGSQYKDTSEAQGWFQRNFNRLRAFFENRSLRDFIFEPFQDVFNTPLKTLDRDIYSVITQVAIVNAVLAGLPGKMGIGVAVSMALEGWMAYAIARHVGIELKSPSDIWKYFSLLAATMAGILWGFKALLGFGYSLFSFVAPVVNPLIIAEIFVTDLFGILFYVGFQECKKKGKFVIPKTLLGSIWKQTKALCDHQWSLLKAIFNVANIKLVGSRLATFLKGEFPIDQRTINGEVFPVAAMAFLLSGQYEKLEGPLGEAFIEAIKLRWSAQFDESSSVEEIAERFREYDFDQLEGVINTVKGKMFEIMVVKAENSDGDQWIGKMHTDETFPGSDIVFSNLDTGEQLEVSLKAVAESNTQIIEKSLAKYPDIPVMTTDEMAAIYDDSSMVFGSGVLHEDLQNITRENFDSLVSSMDVDEYSVVIGGVSIGAAAALWPFVVAYLRGFIEYEQLELVFEKVLGDAGVQLVSRIGYATLFGPLFAWYLLARGVKGLVSAADTEPTTYFVEYLPKINQQSLA
ncbi:hypothetical protein ACFL3W_01035 [Pseudomonadota bacterium]